jgi:outer membrane protein TolC
MKAVILRWLIPVLLACCTSESAFAVETSTSANDPLLAELIDQSLAARPELKSAATRVRAERERVSQAGALPDPTLSFGIQNDGFESIEIGNMETSFLALGIAQTFPWPGKRSLREEITRLGVTELESDVARLELSTIAGVRRAYLDLLLVRDRLALFDQLTMLWEKAEQIARARYESGEGAQSDLLRAQLERARLRQRRTRLRAEEATIVQALNRLRARPLDEPIHTTRSVRTLEHPVLGDIDRELRDAEAASPELAGARAAIERADRGTDLAKRSYYPDLSLSTGIMPRGSLPPMWQATLSFSIPIFAGSKQSANVAENEAIALSSRQSQEAIALSLQERVRERQVALAAALDVLTLYESGLLAQSRATVDSTLAQYGVGRVGFASVLEAIAGHINDQEAHLQTIADAQRIAIARDEISLEPLALGGSEAMGGSAMPGTGPTSAPAMRSNPRSRDSGGEAESRPSMRM